MSKKRHVLTVLGALGALMFALYYVQARLIPRPPVYIYEDEVVELTNQFDPRYQCLKSQIPALWYLITDDFHETTDLDGYGKIGYTQTETGIYFRVYRDIFRFGRYVNETPQKGEEIIIILGRYEPGELTFSPEGGRLAIRIRTCQGQYYFATFVVPDLPEEE